MWLRKKTAVKVSQPKSELSNKAAMQMASMINRAHAWFGSTLNGKTKNLTKRGKIILLVLVCIFFGAGSTYVLIDGLNSPNTSPVIKLKAITIPAHVRQAVTPDVRIREIVPLEEVKKIIRFSAYMDSLKKSPGGRIIRDSILHGRPGLLDSINEVKKIWGIDRSSIRSIDFKPKI